MQTGIGRVVKYTHPTKFNSAPFGALWEVVVDENLSILYIQTGRDLANPKWERTSTIFQRVFEPSLKDPKFLFECLDAFERNQHKDMLKVVKEVLHTID